MEFKYKIQEAIQFLAFAFYPKVTLIVCAVFGITVVGVCVSMMTFISQESRWYNVVFALTTGAAGSFFVSFIVELTSNYRHNKLAWNELKDYYEAVVDYESKKQIMMRLASYETVKDKNYNDFGEDREIEEIDDYDQPKDAIQITWSQLHEFIPVFKQTLDYKKEFLTDIEINELHYILSEYKHIEYVIKECVLMSPMTYDALNHPDEDYLKFFYPLDVIRNMPNWVRKSLSRKQSLKACDRYAEEILMDEFLCSQYMQDYDISQNGLDNYQDEINKVEEEADYSLEDIDCDGIDFDQPDDEESFRKQREDFGKKIMLRQKPFINWLLSKSCRNISDHIDILEKYVLEKPYYSMILELYKNSSKERMDSFL